MQLGFRCSTRPDNSTGLVTMGQKVGFTLTSCPIGRETWFGFHKVNRIMSLKVNKCFNIKVVKKHQSMMSTWLVWFKIEANRKIHYCIGGTKPNCYTKTIRKRKICSQTEIVRKKLELRTKIGLTTVEIMWENGSGLLWVTAGIQLPYWLLKADPLRRDVDESGFWTWGRSMNELLFCDILNRICKWGKRINGVCEK